jgi:hypothetical protein
MSALRFPLFAVCLVAITTAVTPAIAQTVATGPYYAVPSWDQTISCLSLSNCPRFIVLANMNNEAVLDRETGLVWQRTPILTLNSDNHGVASINCSLATTGGRQGWRLPRLDELMTLADATNSQSFQLHLPPGHPFMGLTFNQTFWAADSVPAGLSPGGMYVFFDPQNSPGAYLNTLSGNSFTRVGVKAWCVRGPAGGL